MPKIYTKNTWTDESIVGAERYNILEDGGGAFKSTMQINLANTVSVAGSPVNATRLNNIENGIDALDTLLASLEQYIITPSVTSNNLTVAMKYLDGTDPSSTKKLHFRVGNTEYDVSAATSYTKNAGTNWHNAGSAELAANPIDFFVYAIGETGASAGIKFGHSRIPYAKTMGDFVNTTTNEKYIAGNWTNFNSTDAVQVIGRFRAQLSASASFNWSIASALVINYLIYETDWQNWTPTITGFSANPTNTVNRYRINYDDITIEVRQATAGTSNATTFSMTLPFTAKTITNMVWATQFAGDDNSALLTTPCYANVASAASTMNLYKNMDAGTTAWTASGTKRARTVQLFYDI